ncbi:MAG: oligosaccharide repeat unit polymerase [Scytonematopsis contorta HA4267-MV1]|jgi:oligosaccharide repeat unit polymerase|nr:oligosaccharide repeat unit polymerase [Scytonematopsis contorta HA4267-MV1]
MDNITQIYADLPYTYKFAAILLTCGIIETLVRRKKSWSVPCLIIYITTIIWYFTEVIIYPKYYIKFSQDIKENAYLQIIIFLISFRILTPFLSAKLKPKKLINHPSFVGLSLNVNSLTKILGILWLLLFIYGVSLLNWNFIQALLPVTARDGLSLWARPGGASAGPTGFIVSTGSYIYLLTCSLFGVLLNLQKTNRGRLLNIALILISWPNFILGGSRSAFLAVSMPAFFTYILVSKQRMWIKLIVTAVLFSILNYAFTVVITYRNVGFLEYFNNLSQGVVEKPNTEHEGLNMAEELMFINGFYEQRVLELQYGRDYLVEFLNFVPRAIWPEKPILGLEYNILRGFGSSNSDIGVFATITAGFIGRGVINFGPWFGPIAPAILLSFWCAFISRLWCQRYSVMRLCLFLICLGVTPNLGRDVTMLVLWPAIFGYILVRCLEFINKKRLKRMYLVAHSQEKFSTYKHKNY